MAKTDRGLPLVQRILSQLSDPSAPLRGRKGPVSEPVVGASNAALDALESKLMVELPPTLRAFLAYDFTFASFGKRWHGRHRFGRQASTPAPRITSVRKLAEARTELGWTESRLKTKVVRLPNLPGKRWYALYLGEARRDGELPILGFDADDTHVLVSPRFTSFDLYLADQLVGPLPASQRLEDLDSHVSLNPELGVAEEEDESERYD